MFSRPRFYFYKTIIKDMLLERPSFLREWKLFALIVFVFIAIALTFGISIVGHLQVIQIIDLESTTGIIIPGEGNDAQEAINTIKQSEECRTYWVGYSSGVRQVLDGMMCKLKLIGWSGEGNPPDTCSQLCRCLVPGFEQYCGSIVHEEEISGCQETICKGVKLTDKTSNRDVEYPAGTLDDCLTKINKMENFHCDEIRYYDSDGNPLESGSTAGFSSVEPTKEQLLGKSEPPGLVSVEELSMAGRSESLNQDALAAFKRMADEAKKEGITLYIRSGYRDYDTQNGLWKDDQERQTPPSTRSFPGTSRHHWGTDLDWVCSKAGNELDNGNYMSGGPCHLAYEWMAENGPKYGFCQTYDEDSTREGYEPERWHWSYMPLAKYYLEFYNSKVSASDLDNGVYTLSYQDLIDKQVNGISKNCISFNLAGVTESIMVPEPRGQGASAVCGTELDYSGDFVIDRWPIDKEQSVGSGFGWRFHPVDKVCKCHEGIDIPEKTGTPILAVSEGTVISTETKADYGNYVEIDHGKGYSTFYAHLSSIDVSKGQAVQKGDAIGKVGSTGTSTGPHLHFEVRKEGVRVNPCIYFSPNPGQSCVHASTSCGNNLFQEAKTAVSLTSQASSADSILQLFDAGTDSETCSFGICKHSSKFECIDNGDVLAEVDYTEYCKGHEETPPEEEAGVVQSFTVSDNMPDACLESNTNDKFDEYIAEASKAFGIDKAIIRAMVCKESTFRPSAGSSAGAVGLMQILKGTFDGIPKNQDCISKAEESGLDWGAITSNIDEVYRGRPREDPYQSVMRGTCYYYSNTQRYADLTEPVRTKCALAAYNAGPGNAEMWVDDGCEPSIITFTETRDYVLKIMSWVTPVIS